VIFSKILVVLERKAFSVFSQFFYGFLEINLVVVLKLSWLLREELRDLSQNFSGF
jgi:hypothetical protein